MRRCYSPSRAWCCLATPAGRGRRRHAAHCSHIRAAGSSPSAALSAPSTLPSRHARPASSAASRGPTHPTARSSPTFIISTRMWANAQRDVRPAEYR